MCKVLKQKIWVEGVSYELQEIYGMEHASDGRARTQVCCYDRSCVSLSLSLCACVCVCVLCMEMMLYQVVWSRVGGFDAIISWLH